MDKPEALRLVDALEAQATWVPSGPAGVMHRAAAELRRLHEAHDWQYEMAGERLRRIEKLEAQRDALLEALKSTGLFLHHCWCDVQMNEYSFEKLNQQMAVVDAAISLVEGRVKAVEEGK